MAGAAEGAGAFPITQVADPAQAQFLVGHDGLNLALQSQGGHGDFPAGRVNLSARGFPAAERLDGEVRIFEGHARTGLGDPGAGGRGIRAVAGIPHPVKHQLLAGIELQTKPVPTFLILAKRTGGEFTVEPRQAGDGNPAVADPQFPFRFHPRVGVVVAGVARGGGFLAEPGVALKYDRLQWLRGQFEAELLLRGPSLHLKNRFLGTAEGPVAQLDSAVVRGEVGLAQRAPAEFFGEMEAVGLAVGDGEVTEVDVAHGPGGAGLGGDGLEAVPEEGELVAVGVAGGVLQIAGEVPPLGFEFGMGAVVAGELPAPGRQGSRPVFSRGNCERGNQKRGEALRREDGRSPCTQGLGDRCAVGDREEP